MNTTFEPMKLKRADGKIVEAVFYNFDINEVDILDIKQLKFEGKKTKDITKSDIRDVVFKGKEKLYIQNKKSKITAGLSKNHLNKIISTVFTKDKEGKYGYLKKEIISNVDTIFHVAIPILKHPEIKKPLLFDTQIIHRLASSLKIGGLIFFVMITVKERTDFKDIQIDEFAIYDLYSEAKNKNPLDSSSTVSVENNSMTTRSRYQVNIKKPSDSPSTASVENNSMTFRSHYQTVTLSINDLVEFVKSSMTKAQQ